MEQNRVKGKPCDNHKRRKQGVCSQCKYCKLCPAFEVCTSRDSHQLPKKRGRKKTKINSPQSGVEQEDLPAPDALETSNIAASEASDIPASESSNIITFETPNSRFAQQLRSVTPQNVFHMSSTEFRPLSTKIAALCKVLNIDFERSEIPAIGFNPEVIRNPSRSQQRAKKVASIIAASISAILCPDDPSIFLNLFKGSSTAHEKSVYTRCNDLRQQSAQEKLLKNLLGYALNPHGTISDPAQSLLATSFDRTTCNSMLMKQAQQKCALTKNQVELCEAADNLEGEGDFQLELDEPNIKEYRRLLKSKAKMGKMKFASLRSAAGVLVQDKNFPSAAYRCRLNPIKLQSAMEFIQAYLDVRPGIVRNVRMGSAVFENVPIYERGGLSLKNVFDKYCTIVEEERRVGTNMFYAIVKVLTKKGETRCGMSSYYVDLRHHSIIIDRMLLRIGELFPDKQAECRILQERWNCTKSFIRFDYTSKHVVDSSDVFAHCLHYALGVPCNHVHTTSPCEPCSEFLSLPSDIITFLASLPATDETITMNDAGKCIESAIQRYAAHKVRSSHQAKQIANEAELVSGDKTKIMLVMDHKKKVLPQRYREGQQEFFGKRGMSLLGVAEFYLGETHYADYVIDGYSTQDNVQVFAAITIIKEQISSKYPEVKELILQSDNASCFASHEHVRHVHMLNKQDGPKVTRWIYTESGSGKTSLDCHFSYVNLQFEAFVQDGNVMSCEPNVFDALKYCDGIMNSSAYLLNMRSIDTSGLPKSAFKAKKIGVRQTHDVTWYPSEGEVHLRKFSGLPVVEKVRGIKLDQFQYPDLGVYLESEHHSTKEARSIVPTGKRKSIFHPTHNAMLQAMAASMVYRPVSPTYEPAEDEISQSIQIDRDERGLHDDHFWEENWAKKASNRTAPIPTAACHMLLKWHMEGQVEKGHRWTAEKALYVLQVDTLKYDWFALITTSLQKTKAFFSLSIAKMHELANCGLKECELENKEIEQAASKIVQDETLDNCDELEVDDTSLSPEVYVV